MLAVRGGCSLMAARWQVFFVPQGSPAHPVVLADDCDIFCFVKLSTFQEAAFLRALQYHP